MASQLEAQVFNAASARIVVDGQIIGWAQGIQWSIDDGIADVGVVGSFELLEQQPTVYRVSGSIARWRIRKEAAGVLAKRTSGEVLRAGLFDLEVYDEVSGECIIRIEDITMAGRSGGINAGQLVNETTPFRALRTR